MDTRNTEMFIVTHKEFDIPEHDAKTWVVTGEGQGDFYDSLVDVAFIGGATIQQWGESCAELLKQWAMIDTSKADKIGFCQYKRQWPDLQHTGEAYFDKINDEKDFIVPQKLDLGCTVKAQYAACHPEFVLNDALEAIRDNHLAEQKAVDDVMNRTWIYPHNMYISYTEPMKKYHQWLRMIFECINRKNGWKSSSDVRNTMQAYGRPEYDVRCHAFLAERLFNIYAEDNKLNCISMPIV